MSAPSAPVSPAPPADATARLTLAGITKRYPGCLANDGIDLAVRAGEIHALLGENGAGKSTLVKIIYGVLAADQGDIVWQGERLRSHDPNAARRLGIGMVFQHFSLFEALSVLENIALGLPEARDLGALAARIREVSHSYGLPLDPTRLVHELSVGERQRIEIVRCLLQAPKLLIMDEPTSVLTPQESEVLFKTLRQLAGEGCSILYISHKLQEIRALCERATVLRRGRVVAQCDPRTTSEAELAQLMIGTSLAAPRHREHRAAGEARLQVRNLSLPARTPFGVDLVDIAFALQGGEILGLAGVAGNGQSELLQALSGETRVAAAALTLAGTACGRLGPERRRQLGLAVVPEDRLGQATVPEMTLRDNTLLSARRRMGLVSQGFLRPSRMQAFTARVIAAFDIRPPEPAAPARALSGGNLQKFVIGREIGQEPAVLIAAHPTAGVDAGAAAAIHQALFDLADRGAAVLVVSEDLDELLAISDRIAVLHHGRLSAARPAGEVTAEQLGLLMGGRGDMAPPDAAAARPEGAGALA